MFQWKEVMYEFPKNFTFEVIPEHNVILGIKMWKDVIYLTVPRWDEGVPFTLNWISATDFSKPSPSLRPYPNWELQEIGNCSAIQNIQSMEIDPLGRMWVADIGRRNTRLEQPDNTCPPKLVIIDLSTNEVVRVHVFPNHVASYQTSYLNDIVIDVFHWYAYFSDSNDAAIIVYCLEKNLSWKIMDESMAKETDDGSAVNGITLSQYSTSASMLYYCPQASNKMYSLPTVIVTEGSPINKYVSEYVYLRGSKPTPSKVGGIVMDNYGILYYGLQDMHAIAMWNTSQMPLNEHQTIIAHDDVDLQWPDTFCFDGQGYLWFTTNRLQNYGKLDPEDFNFRVIRMNVNALSYMYPQIRPF